MVRKVVAVALTEQADRLLEVSLVALLELLV